MTYERKEAGVTFTALATKQPRVGDRVLYHWPRSGWSYNMRTPDVNILEGTVTAVAPSGSAVQIIANGAAKASWFDVATCVRDVLPPSPEVSDAHA